MGKKEQMLVTSIFSFSHNSFKSCLSKSHEPFITQSELLLILTKRPFENNVRKGENAGNQHFLLFPQCFKPSQTYFKFSVTFVLSSAMLSNWTSLKIFCLVKS